MKSLKKSILLATLASAALAATALASTSAHAQTSTQAATPQSAAPPTGKIVIRKIVSGYSTETFNFTNPILAIHSYPASFVLQDDGNSAAPVRQEFFDLPAGTYTFKEVLTLAQFGAGWRLTQIECFYGSLPPPSGVPNTVRNYENNSITITLAANSKVDCNFANRRADSIIRIEKIARDLPDFPFKLTGPSYDMIFDLDDDAGVAGGNSPLPNFREFRVPAGPYSIQELQVGGWVLSALVCTPTGQINLATRTATITATSNQPVECTFRNRKT